MAISLSKPVAGRAQLLCQFCGSPRRGLPALRRPDRFLPWLLRIARRIIADWHRSLSREPCTVTDRLDAIPAPDNPLRSIASAEERERLLAALQELPERYGIVITMRFLEGLTPQEIARRLGEPSGTIRNRIFRGLGKLCKLVDDRSRKRR